MLPDTYCTSTHLCNSFLWIWWLTRLFHYCIIVRETPFDASTSCRGEMRPPLPRYCFSVVSSVVLSLIPGFARSRDVFSGAVSFVAGGGGRGCVGGTPLGHFHPSSSIERRERERDRDPTFPVPCSARLSSPFEAYRTCAHARRREKLAAHCSERLTFVISLQGEANMRQGFK